jgi:hypothetical protein
MAQYGFGAGLVFVKPIADYAGNAVSNPTPLKVGELQDISLDMSFDTKLLRGSNQFPVAVGRGAGKVSGKAKFARFNGIMLNIAIFGQGSGTGIRAVFNDTTGGTAIPSTPFQITPVTAYTGLLEGSTPVFVQDLGVVNGTTGLPMKRVASAPAAGQYSVVEATGIYTFSSADNVSAIKAQINFEYTATSTTGVSQAVVNVPMGYAPSFRLELLMSYGGKNMTWILPGCIGSKFTLATRLDDFLIPDFDFEAFADPGGNILYYGLSE